MWTSYLIVLSLTLSFWCCCTFAVPKLPSCSLVDHEPRSVLNRSVSYELFYELEELSRIVNIAYCVGTTGIQNPFLCAGRCQDFKNFELVTTWNTGPFFADSCGYIALSHQPSSPRIIVAFRGTYSITNTIIDLSTFPQEYVPYPAGNDTETHSTSIFQSLLKPLRSARQGENHQQREKCDGCKVHAGFMTSWQLTRAQILLQLEKTIKQNPGYQLTLVGHSLGGAVAALASLDFKARGWDPHVTTFGEPRIGNKPLMRFFNRLFEQDGRKKPGTAYRRVTHVNDPVPLLPMEELGFRMHAGEIYIAKAKLPPTVTDLQHCDGDHDAQCIGGADQSFTVAFDDKTKTWLERSNLTALNTHDEGLLPIPTRLKLWQLFFSHRDYFWRLGLCFPGGDPWDWNRRYSHSDEL